MRPTLQISLHTIAVIFIIVCWLSFNPIRGFPTSSRAASGDHMSARRRGGDDLIVGSDFLNMFIGAKVDPTVRSRRYPLVRADIEEHNQDVDYSISSRTQKPSSDLRDQNRRRNTNIDPNERLSGLIRSQDRRHLETQDQHTSNKVEHSEDFPRRGVRKLVKIVQSVNRPRTTASEESDDSLAQSTIMSDSKVFGSRTISRVNNNFHLAGTTTPKLIREEEAGKYNVETSNADLFSTTETGEEEHTKTDEEIEHAHSNKVEESTDTTRVNTDELVTVTYPPVASQFSISSSVHKTVSRKNGHFNRKNIQDVRFQNTNNEALHTSPIDQTVTDAVSTQDSDSFSSKESFTSSTQSFQTSTEAEDFITTTEAETVTDAETTTQENEEWSSKVTDSTSEPAVTANVEEIPDVVQFQKVGIPSGDQKDAVKVVSVRVTSSVVQTPLESISPMKESNFKKGSEINSVNKGSSRPSSQYESKPSSESQSNLVRLETEDNPMSISIQRSELLVEESSPAEVTASYLTSNSPSYLLPTTISQLPRQRLHFYNHSPVNHRNPTAEALRRSSEDSQSRSAEIAKVTSVQNVGPRKHGGVSSHSFRPEPVSVAESIQRSIITSQDTQRSDMRSESSLRQFQQDENKYVDEEYETFDNGGSYGDDKSRTEGREKKSFSEVEPNDRRYNQPEKVWSEPEKVWGEPAKVYGEPAKVYGEPAKVYGEPAKVWSEPAKVYGEPAKVYGEPAKVWSEPAKVYGEPAKVWGEPAKNYEVDESVSVATNGRAHGVQPSSDAGQTGDQDDSALKMLDSKQQDPNHKFGYVVEGRNFRKYRVEERTSDGFIVGEYGVVSHNDGTLRGVRYTADESINPRLIYDTLVKFLSL